MKPFFRNTIFFIGWMLSPATFWNDTFVNIPLSYIAACALSRLIPVNFAALVITMYWLSNALGLYLMYASGAPILKSRGGVLKEILGIIGTCAVYSLILIALAKFGILKPL